MVEDFNLEIFIIECKNFAQYIASAGSIRSLGNRQCYTSAVTNKGTFSYC